MGGAVQASIDITGSLAETAIAVNAQTAPQQPMRLAPFADPIALENLRTNAILNSESLHLRSVEANGWIGDGSYSQYKETTSFSTQDTEAMQFAIDVSASDLEVSNFLTLLSDQTSPVHGTISGYAKLQGTGTHQHQISITGEINKLKLHRYDSRATNAAVAPIPIRTRSSRCRASL